MQKLHKEMTEFRKFSEDELRKKNDEIWQLQDTLSKIKEQLNGEIDKLKKDLEK